MAGIVIGSATKVFFQETPGDGILSGSYCALSVNWGYAPSTQRFYCIGSWNPFILIHKPTETLSITIYAPGPIISVEPSQGCEDAAMQVTARVEPVVCSTNTGEVFPILKGSWHVQGYSFNKDEAGMPGQETWSLSRWKDLDTPAPSVGEVAYPTFVMRGIAEGQGTANSGMDFGEDAVESYTGSVSAGSFGRAEYILNGTITKVGGGTSSAGEIGQGSANIPLTPMYY